MPSNKEAADKAARKAANARIAKPALKVARKANESDADYIDRYLAALHGRSVKIAKHHV